LWAANFSSVPTSSPSRVVGQRLETDALGRRDDLEPALGDVRDAGGVALEQGRASATVFAPFAEKDSGAKPSRSVKRQASSVVSGTGSSW